MNVKQLKDFIIRNVNDLEVVVYTNHQSRPIFINNGPIQVIDILNSINYILRDNPEDTIISFNGLDILDVVGKRNSVKDIMYIKLIIEPTYGEEENTKETINIANILQIVTPNSDLRNDFWTDKENITNIATNVICDIIDTAMCYRRNDSLSDEELQNEIKIMKEKIITNINELETQIKKNIKDDIDKIFNTYERMI